MSGDRIEPPSDSRCPHGNYLRGPIECGECIWEWEHADEPPFISDEPVTYYQSDTDTLWTRNPETGEWERWEEPTSNG